MRVGPKANMRRSDCAGSVLCKDAVGLDGSASHIPEEAHMRARPGSGTDGSPATRPVHSNAALREGYATQRRPRRYPRFTVSWPVVVEAGKRGFLLQAVNVSGRGAKVGPTDRLREGSLPPLPLHPPPRPPPHVPPLRRPL